MNILIFNWRDPQNPASGGAEIVTLGHAREWVNRGHNVTWFTSRFQGAAIESKLDGVKIIRQGGQFSVFLYAFFWYLCSRDRFDLVVDEIHGIPFFTPLYCRKPKIAFIHEVAGDIWNYMMPLPLNLLGRYIEHLYFLLYRNIVFWTDAPSTIDDLEYMGIARDRCIAIPCPIQHRSLKAPSQKSKHPTFIYVGRLVKMKGIEDVIEAFHVVKRAVPEASLWIVGSGEPSYVHKLKRVINRKGLQEDVLFLGRVSDREKLSRMARAHILIHASVKEGWGLVVLEAASQSTPSIVYNVSGLRDVVKDNVTGIVTKKNTPTELAQQILYLLKHKDLYRSFQQKGLTFVKQFTWNQVSRSSLFLLQRVYNEHRSKQV